MPQRGVIVLHVGTEAMLLALPETGNLLPEWYSCPDEAQSPTLVQLGQELGNLWLRAPAIVEKVEAAAVPSIAEAVLR